MTNPDTFIALAERCEQAAGPSNGLDAEIALAIGYTHERRGTERACWWRTPAGQQLAYVGYKNHPPFFTGSLDAAVTLVPEGWTWARFRGGVVECMTRNGPNDFTLFEHGEGISAALALCAAALRARAAMAQPSSET
jgi:hypothetical protein